MAAYINFKKWVVLGLWLLILGLPAFSLAATLQLSPGTGVYNLGGVYTVRVVVNTGGVSINAAEGVLKYNPQELAVVSIDRSSSIFNLWVTEPTFSNAAGTITFSGGAPTGYSGSNGTIFNVSFRSLVASESRVSFTSGAVLANDGRGTNAISGMSGGTYTISPVSTLPIPERVEYVAPANTPAVPVVSSNTHSSQAIWYQSKSANLSWSLPSGITAVRTLLDQSPTTIPTKVYDNPIANIALENLPEGVSYFHLQFRNAEGWGRVTHFKLQVDSQKPTSLDISSPADVDMSAVRQSLLLKSIDETSEVFRYFVKINNDEPIEFIDIEKTGSITLPALKPGYYSLIVEAFDQAGNSIVDSFSFEITAFTAPYFTDLPSEITEDVIPVFKGITKPGATVIAEINKLGTEPVVYQVEADTNGVFLVIPSGTFTRGVYEIILYATDAQGAQSENSTIYRLAVQPPGYMQIGSWLVSVLSVMVPLLALAFISILLIWWLILYVRRLRTKVVKESGEAVSMVHKEFHSLDNLVSEAALEMAIKRRSKKLNVDEEAIIVNLQTKLTEAKTKILKEVVDLNVIIKSK